MKALQSLRIASVKRCGHLSFNLFNFCFFKNSERGNVLFFGSPRLLAPLVFVPYALVLQIMHFRGKRFFIMFKEQVAGLLAVQEKPEALYIHSLAVNPQYRRLGIGVYMLNYANLLATRLKKKWLELSVMKANTPAQKLYKKFGFVKKEEKHWSFTLRKNVEAF
jgi:ribosomal protein S18 acetylase RimI-like enzyme